MELVAGSMVIAFCLVGGLIAYFADILGRHLGKTRKTLFHLRPRHTAALITTVAGCLVPLVTVGLMALVSKDVRTILKEGSQAAAQRDAIKTQLGSVSQKLETSGRELGNKKGEIVLLEKKRGELQGRYVERTKELGEREKQLKAKQLELANLKSSIGSLKEKVKLFQQNVALARREVSRLLPQLASLRREKQSVDATRNEAQKQLRDMSAFQQKLLLDSADLEKEIRDKEKQVSDLKLRGSKAQDELKSAKEELNRMFTEMQSELEKVKLQLDEAKAERDRVASDSQTLVNNIGSARTQDMIFRRGEELARRILGPSSSRDEADSAVSALLRSAKIVAQNAGADAKSNAAGFGDMNVDGRIYSAAAQQEDLVKALTGRKEEVCLVANVIWNSFLGEFVPLKITPWPNPVVYRAGQLIAETRIDGSLSREAIINQIQRLLSQDVKQKARRDKMIPAVGRDAEFGSVSSDDVLAIVETLKTSGRTLRVQVVAIQDTRAADPLRLEFRIK